jgi:hypothetical protein
LNQITGAGANSRVIINGNNNLLTFNASSGAPWTFRFNGADYVTVNNLQMQGTNGTYAMVCMFTNSANNNIVSACTMSCNPNITSSSYAVPLIWSASSTAPSTGASSGDNNLVTDCQIFSGYYAVMMYGLTSAPYNKDNTIQRCAIQDFYYIGIYNYYQWNTKLIQNIVERPTRTSLYYFYGIYSIDAFGSIIDGNIIQKPWEMQPTQTSYYAYGIYAQAYGSPMPVGASKVIIRNNILRNFRSNYFFYGIMNYYNVDVIHNTISFDNAASSNSSTIYGIYSYAQPNQEHAIKNNLVSITMGGSGPKYGMYINVSGLPAPAPTTISGSITARMPTGPPGRQPGPIRTGPTSTPISSTFSLTIILPTPA